MRNIESVEIGCSPHEEDCAQLGHTEDFEKWNRVECRILADQMRRMYPELCEKVRFKVQSNHHDFGTYYELCALASLDDEEAVDAAWELQNLLPDKWDEEAIKALEQAEHPSYYTKVVSIRKVA